MNYFIKTSEGEYLTGRCDNLGRPVTTPDVEDAWHYEKQHADAVISGDARLQGAQLIPTEPV